MQGERDDLWKFRRTEVWKKRVGEAIRDGWEVGGVGHAVNTSTAYLKKNGETGRQLTLYYNSAWYEASRAHPGDGEQSWRESWYKAL